MAAARAVWGGGGGVGRGGGGGEGRFFEWGHRAVPLGKGLVYASADVRGGRGPVKKNRTLACHLTCYP